MNTIPYNIVIATDDNYAIHGRTLIRSVKTNEPHPVKFWVLSFNLSINERYNFNSLIDTNCEIEILDINNEMLSKRLFRGIDVAADRSLATYARLLIPELLPTDIDRCVYMDVDAVVLNSIRPMFDIDLDGFAAARVVDTNPISRHLAVGLNATDIYINAGMIVWNMEWCRKNEVVNKFAAFIFERKGNIDAMDQGTFNGVLSKHIKPLAPRFNALTSFFQLDAKGLKYLYGGELRSQKEIEQARKEPIFVHFTPNNTTRPWVKNCRHPLRKEYWRYCEIMVRLQDDTRSLKLKVIAMLFNLLPVRVYRALMTLK